MIDLEYRKNGEIARLAPKPRPVGVFPDRRARRRSTTIDEAGR
ncbi:hypothetical protein [Paraburkholderia sp. ZP32-5]|nr:hypothetical protein [Paraburkholderia sp. ZP32-5]